MKPTNKMIKKNRKFETKYKNNQKIFCKYCVKNKIILLIKNIKNARFKKKLSYKFIQFFEMIDVINT